MIQSEKGVREVKLRAGERPWPLIIFITPDLMRRE
jgi:hypothetical protein